MSSINFQRINTAAIPRLGEVLPHWLPGGHVEGDEYVCGDISGAAGRSLSINMQTGVWRDFAGTDGGSDPVSLFAAIRGLAQGEAARELARDFGIEYDISSKPARRSRGQIVASYDYLGADGKLIFQVTRWEPKTFSQRRPDGQGGWINSVKGVELVPYHLPEIIKAKAVFVTEGEKDSDALAALGLTATTSPQGAGKWRASYNQWFVGKRVCVLPDADTPGREHAQKVAGNLCGVAEVVKILELPNLPPKGDVSDWLAAGGTREALLEMVKAATAWKAESVEAPDAEALIVEDGKLPFIVDAVEKNILTRPDLRPEHQIYQRGPELVRIVHAPETSTSNGVTRHQGAARIVEMDKAGLQDVLGRYGAFKKWDRRSKAYRQIDTPREIAETYLSRQGMWNVPVLRGIVASPTIMSDGRVITKPGYDPETGFYFSHNLTINVPEKPTLDDAKDVLTALGGLLCGFNFLDSADSAVALAQIVTLMVRPATETAPLIATTAPTRGSGKSELANVAAAIATGRPCTALSATADPIELEKRIGSTMLAGDQVVCIDNLNGALTTNLLCQAITAPAVSLRIFGALRNIEVPNTATWLANGNNLRIADDLARRAILCRLDPRCERPEERVFDFDPVARALELRAKYVAAVLTIVKAYITAGSPDMGLKPFGSFGTWCSMVRAPLVWAGCADPCASREEILEDDPDAAQLRALVAAWAERFGRTPRIVKEIVKAGEEDSDVGRALGAALEDIAGDGRGNVNTKRLGWWLRQHVGRIVNGFRIIQAGTSRVAEWKLLPAGE